jgi:hypothetical protein
LRGLGPRGIRRDLLSANDVEFNEALQQFLASLPA